MLNSENRRLKLGVTAAFLILILLNLGAWLLLRFSQRSLFAGGPLLSAAAQAALAMGLRSILRPVYAVLGYLLSGVFLFAALRLTRRRSGIFCLLHGALQLGTLVIPAARSASAAGELVDINWVLYLFLLLLSCGGVLLIQWLAAPFFARRLPEPAAVALACIASAAWALLLSLLTLPVMLGSGYADAVLPTVRESLIDVAVKLAVCLLAYFLLNRLFRQKAPAQG
ncbi:MAG TPA: hypothetical protein H9674_04240 [Firmicutes bacterium]|nr:hypothetical protein [Bacillota bacterium]